MTPHDHPDTERLTIGCAGCVDRVRADQRLAEADEWPTFTVDLHVALDPTTTKVTIKAPSADQIADAAENPVNAKAIADALFQAACGATVADWNVEG